MATFTKGFVLTENKDAFLIADLTRKAIRELQRDHLDKFPKQGSENPAIDFDAVKTSKEFTRQAVLSSFPKIGINPEMKGLDFNFGIHSFCKDSEDQVEFEKRTLTAYFDCDLDRAEYGDKSITFLMGDYGKSCEIMKAVITKIAEHLQCDGYFMASDCSSDSKFQKIVEAQNAVDSLSPSV